MNFPISAAFGNVLVNQRGDAAALFRLGTVSYPFLPVRDKEMWLSNLARFAYTAEANFSLYRVSRFYPADDYQRQAAGLLDHRAAPERWHGLLAQHEDRLRGLRSFAPEVYALVSLKPVAQSGQSNLSAGLLARVDAFKRRSARLRVTDRQLGALLTAEDRAHRQLTGAVPARQATSMELQWLLRRAALRGVTEPMIDQYWTPRGIEVTGDGGERAYEPLGYTVERHGNAPVVEEARTLVVDGDEARTYQAMLTLGALPEVAEFPGGAELLFTPLEALQFPVDVAVHCRWIPNRTAVSKTRNRIVDADNAYREETLSEHGSLSALTDENRSLARGLDLYLQSHERPPLLNAAVSFAVGAASRDELERRVERLRNRFGTVMLHQPLALQHDLYMDHFPRPDGGTVRDYQEVMTKEQFAALMPIGTHEAGSDQGVYIGHTLTAGRRPVKYDITEASRVARSPSILVAGMPGSGKTMTVQQFAIHAGTRGSLVVDVDPKPDHNLEGIAELAGMVDVIELSGRDEYRGSLDPLLVAPESVREDLTASYLMDLLPGAPRTWETQVRKAVRTAMGMGGYGCLNVIDLLLGWGDPDAHAAGDALGVWADSGIGRLGFGRGGGTLRQAALPVTTIKAAALNLPDPGVPRADWDQSERLSVATLKLLVAYAMRLITTDRSRHKLVVFDEAHFLLDSNAGRRLFDRLNRMGRSMNATLLLASQRLSDSGDLEALVGTRLIFGQETEQDAKVALQLLGLDPEDRGLVARVRAFRKGRCLLRDIHDRVAELQIDLVNEEWLRVLDTSPQAVAA